MSKGLKQMVAEATEEAAPPVQPASVAVSGEAYRALAHLMRQWSGWPNARLELGDPTKFGSPFAKCDHPERSFMVNVDALSRNPNRVLNTVTPFRLRQEAVLTGVLLHEAGHARHTHWFRNHDGTVRSDLTHGTGSVHDGEPVTAQTLAFARLMEEPRVEGMMTRNAENVGAVGLTWTMRASGADLMPMTALAAAPGQKMMDLVAAWALRAGKQIAFGQWTPGYTLPNWVQNFTSLVHSAIHDYLSNFDSVTDPARDASEIMRLLTMMCVAVDDRGTYMMDTARDVLDLLFPETEGDEDQQPMPQIGVGCAADQAPSEEGDEGEGSDAGADGTGNTEPEDEGEGEDPGAGSTGQDEAEQPDDSEPEQDEQDEPEQPEQDEPEQEDQPEQPEQDEQDEAEQDEQPEPASPSSGAGEQPETDTESELAKALAALEADSRDEIEGEAEQIAADMADPSSGAGSGSAGGEGGGWRNPTKDERDIAKSAERFLRDQIEPSEAGKVYLDDAPSNVVDGAAYDEWKRGGMIHAPRFFKHIRRTVQPSPPVKIAVLVDVSGSMDELQEPSAVLSWALASAALDLRNFAGRGVQIESTLIHWGDRAEVIQKNGATLPGLREFMCWQGTSAMDDALELVDQEIPGFFDASATPENRLLVQFTDWELNWGCKNTIVPWISRALESGVNMLTIAPRDYSPRRSDLPNTLAACRVQRGKTALMRYDRSNPEGVWDAASELLEGPTPAPFAGF